MKGGIGCYPKTPAQKWGSRGQAGFGESDGLKDPETFVPRIVSFPSLAFSWDFVSRRGKRGFRTSARNFAGIPLAQSAHIWEAFSVPAGLSPPCLVALRLAVAAGPPAPSFWLFSGPLSRHRGLSETVLNAANEGTIRGAGKVSPSLWGSMDFPSGHRPAGPPCRSGCGFMPQFLLQLPTGPLSGGGVASAG